MSDMPRLLELLLTYRIPKRQAREVWDWLESNSNTVIVDTLEIAIRKRRDWTKEDEK